MLVAQQLAGEIIAIAGVPSAVCIPSVARREDDAGGVWRGLCEVYGQDTTVAATPVLTPLYGILAISTAGLISRMQVLSATARLVESRREDLVVSLSELDYCGTLLVATVAECQDYALMMVISMFKGLMWSSNHFASPANSTLRAPIARNPCTMLAALCRF